LVSIAKSEEDRRKSFIHLTRRGQRLAAAMSPLISEVNEQAMADLTESEILTFKRLIVRLQRTLDAESGHRNSWSERRTERLAEEVGL
jgi:DNA-binding MarR family transcriptional regulator